MHPSDAISENDLVERTALEPVPALTLQDEYPVAVARLGWGIVGRFLLDHDKQTARLYATTPWESGGACGGVHAEVVPFRETYDLDSLPGFELRLMSHPFNTAVVYDIVGNVPRS